jgi:hypothetical protein
MFETESNQMSSCLIKLSNVDEGVIIFKPLHIARTPSIIVLFNSSICFIFSKTYANAFLIRDVLALRSGISLCTSFRALLYLQKFLDPGINRRKTEDIS